MQLEYRLQVTSWINRDRRCFDRHYDYSLKRKINTENSDVNRNERQEDYSNGIFITLIPT